jgi:hypothetical protein
MIRFIALAFTLTVLTTSAQAMPKLVVPEGLVTQVAQACGVGFRRVGGVCVRRATVRQTRRVVRRDVRQTRRVIRRTARRCARWSAGTCLRYY